MPSPMASRMRMPIAVVIGLSLRCVCACACERGQRFGDSHRARRLSFERAADLLRFVNKRFEKVRNLFDGADSELPRRVVKRPFGPGLLVRSADMPTPFGERNAPLASHLRVADFRTPVVTVLVVAVAA